MLEPPRMDRPLPKLDMQTHLRKLLSALWDGRLAKVFSVLRQNGFSGVAVRAHNLSRLKLTLRHRGVVATFLKPHATALDVNGNPP